MTEEERQLQQFFNRTVREGDCWIWQGAKLNKHAADSYGLMGTRRSGTRLLHRYICGQVHGLEPGQMAMHSCDRKACINPTHLVPGTARQNSFDAYHRGLKSMPDPIPMLHAGTTRLATLKPNDVRSIRKFLEDGVSGSKIATQFKISQATISLIKSGSIWSHIT
jgi:hypothetical protein